VKPLCGLINKPLLLRRRAHARVCNNRKRRKNKDKRQDEKDKAKVKEYKKEQNKRKIKQKNIMKTIDERGKKNQQKAQWKRNLDDQEN